jgi:hypothetical protein
MGAPVKGYLLAVDPGQAHCGAALFLDGELRAAALVRHPDRHDAGLESLRLMAAKVAEWCRYQTGLGTDNFDGHLICEWPKAYYGEKSQAPVDDLMPMCGIDGALAALLPGASCEYVRPYEWGAKGKPKPGQAYIVEGMVRRRLSPAEAMRIAPCPKSKQNNIFDAIGIGLHRCGRSLADNPKRVIAR